MKILVSACLLGASCRYDGTGKCCEALAALAREQELIPFCPEIYGGLGIPRDPAERSGESVLTESGRDVTAAYETGAREALRLARLFGCELAILKERSPACGHGRIHDGSFTGALTDGDGVAAALLLENGIRVIGESEIEAFFSAAGSGAAL